MYSVRKVIAAVAITSLGPAVIPIASAAEPSPGALRRPICQLAKLPGKSIDTSKLHSTGEISISGWRVNVRRGNWAQEHPTNPVSTIAFHSGAWMVPQAETEIAASVELLLAYSRALPDPKTNQTSDLGWRESMTTKRLLVAACLYAASGDNRLVKVVGHLAEANMDPNRYYGPPKARSHNHGVMADRSLLEASEVMNRPDWRATAISRLKKQLAGYFDQCGMTYEQASAYQLFNARLWRAMGQRVLPHDPSFADKISGAAAEADDMARTLANPDGSYEIIGAGTSVEMAQGDVLMTSRWCSQTGWSVDKLRANGLTQQTITRFGPFTALHGHEDKGAVTWWVGSGSVGKRVLVDRGLHGKNRDWRLDYAKSARGHSTLLWDGGANLSLMGSRKATRSGVFTKLSGSVRGTRWTREISASRSVPLLRVDDNLSGSLAAGGATSQFQLAPGWVPSGDVFVTADGWRLRISCRVRGGSTFPASAAKVEHYDGYGSVEKAYTATCRAPGGSRVRSLDVAATLRVVRP